MGVGGATRLPPHAVQLQKVVLSRQKSPALQVSIGKKAVAGRFSTRCIERPVAARVTTTQRSVNQADPRRHQDHQGH